MKKRFVLLITEVAAVEIAALGIIWKRAIMDDSFIPSANDCFASVSFTKYIGDVFVFFAIRFITFLSSDALCVSYFVNSFGRYCVSR